MSGVFWGLPDRNQEGDIFIINLNDNEKIDTVEFYRKFKIKEQNTNKEFIGGIPSELLSKFKNDDFGFGQCIRVGKKYVFTISRRCGLDNDNRTVTSTYFQIVDNIDDIRFPTIGDIQKLNSLDPTIEFGIDGKSKKAIDKMLIALRKFPHLNSFCSEKIYKSVHKHAWNGEDVKPVKKWIWLGLVLIILLVYCVLALIK